MIHVHVLGLQCLLLLCAAFTGSGTSLLILIGLLMFRTPRQCISRGVVYLTVTLHVLQVVSTCIVNIATGSSDSARAQVFGSSPAASITKGFGIYEIASGSAWKFVASVVPELLVIAYCIALRIRLTHSAGGVQSFRRTVRWLLPVWGVVSGFAALISPSILGGVYLLMSLFVFCCVTFKSTLLRSGIVRSAGTVTSLIGCLIIATWGIGQNYAATSAFRDGIDDVVGLAVFCNFESFAEVRFGIQFLFVFLSTVLGQLASNISELLWSDVHREQEAARALVVATSSQRSVEDRRGEHQHLTTAAAAAADRAHSSGQWLSPPVPQSHHHVPQAHTTNVVAVPVATTSTQQFSRSTFASDGAAVADGKSSSSGDVFDALMRVFRYLAKWIMNNFIILPLFPMMCIVALIVAFPSIPSMSLFPTLLMGLLAPNKMGDWLLILLALFGVVLVTQYIVYAAAQDGSLLLRLFLCAESTGWQLVEITCNYFAFLVLLATYVQQVRAKQEEVFRREQEEQVKQEEEQAILQVAEARRRTGSKAIGPAAAASGGGAAMMRETSLVGAENTTAMLMGQRESTSSTRFFVDPNDRSATRLAAEELLGEDRVRYIETALEHVDPGLPALSGRFFTLCGRMPNDEELEFLRQLGPDPLSQVLFRRAILAKLPLWRKLIHDAAILLNYYSLNFTIFFTFIAGSCVYHLDILHAIVLVLFLVYIAASNVARKYWALLVFYIAMLTMYEVLFTFIAQFVEIPFRILPFVRSRTVGLTPMPSRWSALPYFVVLFFVCGQMHLLHAAKYNWDELFTIYEWQQLARLPAMRLIRQRMTLLVAAAVFVALGLFESRSLVVEGFLIFFLVICICTAYGATNRVLGILWRVACGYAGVIIATVCAYQFLDIASQIDIVIAKIPGCEMAATNSTLCQREIGLVAPEEYVLTYFLAPWFVALVTSMAHIAATNTFVDDEREQDRQNEKMKKAKKEHGATTVLATNNSREVHEQHQQQGEGGGAQQQPLSESSRLILGGPRSNDSGMLNGSESSSSLAETARKLLGSRDHRSPSTKEMLIIANRATPGHGADQQQREEQEENQNQVWHRTCKLNETEIQRFSFPDQILFSVIIYVVRFVDAAGGILSWIGREYGAIILWTALCIAATSEYTLMSAAYAVFFVFDMSSIASLIYCVVHLFALYSYQFSFTPKIDAMWENTDWAELLGFIKSNAQAATAIGPVLVFFAVLFRAKTAPVHDENRRVNAAERNHHHHHHPHHRREEEKNTWLSYIHHQGFYLVGHEIFMIFAILTFRSSAHVASGVVAAVIVAIAGLGGRSRFYRSGMIVFVLHLLTMSVFVFELIVQLNIAHNLWQDNENPNSTLPPSETWKYWGLDGRLEALYFMFICIMVLHSCRDKWRRVQCDAAEERVETWIERHLYRQAPNLIYFLARVYNNEPEKEALIRGGFNTAQPHEKRMGNMLKHCNETKLNVVMPPLPETLDPWVAKEIIATEDAASNISGNNHCVTREEDVYEQKEQQQQQQQQSTSHLSYETSSSAALIDSMHVLIAGGTSTTTNANNDIPPPPSHYLHHRTVMTWTVKIVSVCSPVSIASFAAGNVNPSVLCVALMVAGLLQFSYQELVHWKFYRWWPRIEGTYYAILLGLPLLINIPPIAVRITQSWNVNSIIGFAESDTPMGLDVARTVLLVIIVLQSRVYEEFWFESVIRSMRHNLHERAQKHELLMAALQKQRGLELEEFERRDAELRAKLDEVRSMFTLEGGITFGSDGNATGETAQAAVRKVPRFVDETKTLLPGMKADAFDAKTAPRASSPVVAGVVASPVVESSTHLGPKNTSMSSNNKLKRLSLRLSFTQTLSAASFADTKKDDNEADDDATDNSSTTSGSISSNKEDQGKPTAHSKKSDDEDDKDDGKPTRYEQMQEAALAATEMLIPQAYDPDPLREELMHSEKLHPFHCFFIALLRALERHTASIAILFMVANYAQSGTFFDAVPVAFMLGFVCVYHPFAPFRAYDLLSQYIVVGIIIKGIVVIVAAHMHLSSGFVSFLRWAVVDVTNIVVSKDTLTTTDDTITQTSAYGDELLDFFTFAMVVIHKQLSCVNGVYSEIDASKQQAALSEDETTEGSPAALPILLEAPPRYSGAPPTDSVEDGLYVPIPEASPKQQQPVLSLDPSLTPIQDGAGKRSSSSPWSEFVDNAVHVQGSGTDLYTLYTFLELVSLLIIVFNYYSISGSSANGSIVQNVQDNVLPGPFVMAVIATLTAMIIDRMVYASSNMHAKLTFHIGYVLTAVVCFTVWRKYMDPPLISAGIVLFLTKCAYFYLSCWQLRRGYAAHRRHDPFTHLPDEILPWIGYTIFRAIPFLWETRVVTDWLVTRTALRLSCYLKVENLFDTVYNRFVSMGESRAQQPDIGTAVKLSAKLSDGAVRLVIMLFAILFPLIYYCNFNPAMGSNQIAQIQVDVAFENTSPFFSSSLFNILEYPGDLALWLQRTRPILGSYGITDRGKQVQMIDLSSCSNSLWGISPQAQRLLVAQLNQTYQNLSTTSLNLQVIVTRGGSDQQGVSQTIRHPWSMPWYVAGQIMDALSNATNTTEDSATIPLYEFYSPYVFNQPTQVQYFPSMVGNDTLDTEECTIVLRTEFDQLIQSKVHYWCLKCNSIFFSGNYPNSSLKYYPEYNCLTKDIGCNRFNFETYATNYTPVPMYFVFFSDPIPQTLSFLPNIGIIAIYTTFVLALGRVFRTMFSTSAANIVQTDMADPTPVAQLIEYIAIARACGDLPLEQSVYYELIDLLRSPERLLQVTGLHRKMRSEPEGDTMPNATSNAAAAPA